MTMKRTFTVLLAILLVGAPPATADDASMKRAWDSQDPAFRELSKSVTREFKRWADRGHTRDGKLLRLLKRGETLTTAVEQAVNAEQPATPQGTEAKTWILKALATFKAHFAEDRKAVRAAPSRRAVRHGKEADRLFKQSGEEADRAKELLRQVGVQ
jgi:hypothetical protein